MTGLRERQKVKRRQAMLDAADKLFYDLGFNKTTMDMIAEDSEVGVATVYKYFTTKITIACELLRPELEETFQEGGEFIKNPPADPAVAMVGLLQCYYKLRNNWSDKTFLSSFEFRDARRNEGALAELVVWANQHVLQQIRELLDVFLARGELSKTIDLDDVSAIIFAIFDYHYQNYISDEQSLNEDAINEINRRVALLFESWRT